MLGLLRSDNGLREAISIAWAMFFSKSVAVYLDFNCINASIDKLDKSVVSEIAGGDVCACITKVLIVSMHKRKSVFI
jgi:hypothetical protein